MQRYPIYVVTEISMYPKWIFSIFFGVLGHWYLGFYTPYRHETFTKVPIFMSATIWHWILFKWGYRKIWKSKFIPLDLNLERSHWEDYNGISFPLYTPYGVGEINVWIFWQGFHLKSSHNIILCYREYNNIIMWAVVCQRSIRIGSI